MAKNRLQDTLEERNIEKEKKSREQQAQERLAEKEYRKEKTEDKKANKRSYKIEKIKELTAKAYAVATKRKWLVFLIGIALVAYFVISSGGFGGLGGIVDKVKSFF